MVWLCFTVILSRRKQEIIGLNSAAQHDPQLCKVDTRTILHTAIITTSSGLQFGGRSNDGDARFKMKKSDKNLREWQLDLWDDYGSGVNIRPATVAFVEDPLEGQSLEVEIETFLKGEGTFNDGQEAPVNFELNLFDSHGDQIVIASRIEKVTMLFDKMANKMILTGKFTKVCRWGLND